MKNNLKVIGFIAVVAIIAMGIVGCGPAPEDVNIIEPDLGFIVGETLRVDTVGDTEWYSGDNATTPVSKEATFTPQNAGRYYAKVGGTQSNNYADVFAIPLTTTTFNYKMTGSATENANWSSDGTSTVNNETVEITKNSFTLTSDKQFNSNPEKLQFTITNWKKLEGGASGYPTGYKLSISNVTQNAPAANNYFSGNPENMSIYATNDLASFIRTRPGTENFAPKGGVGDAGAGQDPTKARIYRKNNK